MTRLKRQVSSEEAEQRRMRNHPPRRIGTTTHAQPPTPAHRHTVTSGLPAAAPALHNTGPSPVHRHGTCSSAMWRTTARRALRPTAPSTECDATNVERSGERDASEDRVFMGLASAYPPPECLILAGPNCS